jgi:hypothetical protein
LLKCLLQAEKKKSKDTKEEKEKSKKTKTASPRQSPRLCASAAAASAVPAIDIGKKRKADAAPLTPAAQGGGVCSETPTSLGGGGASKSGSRAGTALSDLLVSSAPRP